MKLNEFTGNGYYVCGGVYIYVTEVLQPDNHACVLVKVTDYAGDLSKISLTKYEFKDHILLSLSYKTVDQLQLANYNDVKKAIQDALVEGVRELKKNGGDVFVTTIHCQMSEKRRAKLEFGLLI